MTMSTPIFGQSLLLAWDTNVQSCPFITLH